MDSEKSASSLGEMITLQSDNGSELTFKGKVFSENSYYDEETTALTKLRLFVVEDGLLIYSIVSGSGSSRIKRHYTVWVQGEMCLMSDGVLSITVPIEMLFSAVFGLCGIDPARAEELRSAFEETLRAANG